MARNGGTELNQSTILKPKQMVVIAQFGQMAGKNSQRQFKDCIHVMSHFPTLRKRVLILALIR